MTDNHIEIGPACIAKSHNFSGSIIYWNKDRYDSWLVIGYRGLTFCHAKDGTDDPSIKHINHIYNIVGVDET